jgi:DNA-binding NtrC family response regulator
MRVLIIDDDRAHGESLSDLLNSRGHDAYFAPNVSEARWLLGLFRFDLAIVDYDMPDGVGPQVARSLEELDPELKAIVMSARQKDVELRRELEHFPFLPKPIRVEELLGAIAHFAHQQRGSSLVVRVSFPLERWKKRTGS